MELKETIKNSFRRVKRDFDILRVTLHDWVNYLVHRDNELQKRIEALEARVRQLEEQNKILVATY
ncbi:hypothetical protein KY345_01760 [Candidatus Woesearchaeota archaeon]|nr:hypothetical protein [Candidatus Woesearchaeota archaeon]